VTSERRLAFQAFYADVLETLKERSPGITAASRTQPESWFNFASGRTGVAFGWSFVSQSRFRVEVYIDAGQRERNLAIFEALQQQREEIEQGMGVSLEWEALEGRRATRIAAYTPFLVTIESTEEELSQLKEWLMTTTVEMVRAFRNRLKTLAK
jgi:hypothetical protein